MPPQSGNFTTTALGRWSSIQKQLPPVENISEVNVFDFDNTLFRTPLPNPQVWDGRSIGTLSSDDAFMNGGWWHDDRILSSTGGGIEVQEPKAWDGFWDESIVEEVKQSMASPTAVTVLMTGRGQAKFSELLARMVKSKGLEFDMMVLKPSVGPDGVQYYSTLDFKKEFFRVAMLTYKHATELTIFEDRPKQAKGFEDYLAVLNQEWAANPAAGRNPVRTEIVLVDPRLTYLDPMAEFNVIADIIDASNLAVKMGRAKSSAKSWNLIKSRIYTGYIVPPADTVRLLKLVPEPSADEKNDFRTLADNIMISFRPPRDDIIRRAGGWNSHRKWRVNGIGSHQGSIWAARLSPVDPNLTTYTESFTPLIVLLMKKSVKASEANRINNWVNIPPNDERAIVFDSTVQDKVVIKVVEAPEKGFYDADGKVILDSNSFDRNSQTKPRSGSKQDRIPPRHQPIPVDQSSADSSDGGADAFPPLSRAVQQANPGGRRRGGHRHQQQQGGQHQNRGQNRNFSGGGQHGQGHGHGGQQHGQGDRPRNNRGGRGGGRGGQGRQGQYRSLDDAGGGNTGGAAGMMY
ncbi:hypothetical protein BDZ85DRAFT_252657 [Elsinoe ampelina]|uniref:Swiss Army Knife RNA repair protein HAD domain-containing protein n=1 Tax=Elsinoe ampelina TaxID=302913 RepID=A0A6A6G1C6_9PEZI|nr:hypothetical protein BDZ85DRAFT_252657 [Elsinoe ampelina]